MPDNPNIDPEDPITEEEIREWEDAEKKVNESTTDPELIRLKNLSISELMNEDVGTVEAEIGEMETATPAPEAASPPSPPDIPEHCDCGYSSGGDYSSENDVINPNIEEDED